MGFFPPDHERGADVARQSNAPSFSIFARFIHSYMAGWSPKDKVLWRDYRNGFTHAMVGKSCYEYLEDPECKWRNMRGELFYINPPKLFQDFCMVTILSFIIYPPVAHCIVISFNSSRSGSCNEVNGLTITGAQSFSELI